MLRFLEIVSLVLFQKQVTAKIMVGFLYYFLITRNYICIRINFLRIKSMYFITYFKTAILKWTQSQIRTLQI